MNAVKRTPVTPVRQPSVEFALAFRVGEQLDDGLLHAGEQLGRQSLADGHVSSLAIAFVRQTGLALCVRHRTPKTLLP